MMGQLSVHDLQHLETRDDHRETASQFLRIWTVRFKLHLRHLRPIFRLIWRSLIEKSRLGSLNLRRAHCGREASWSDQRRSSWKWCKMIKPQVGRETTKSNRPRKGGGCLGRTQLAESDIWVCPKMGYKMGSYTVPMGTKFLHGRAWSLFGTALWRQVMSFSKGKQADGLYTTWLLKIFVWQW